MSQKPFAEPLHGVRVVDLTRNLAGPFCTMLLGDLGADVVKVESPNGGDDTRAWKPPEWSGVSAVFLAANRNKRSIAVDLDSDRGREVVRDLARRADVFVESFRTGSLVRRELSYEHIKELNERIIYCSISAYGKGGPKSHLPGYDPVIQAGTGIMDLTGFPEGRPTRLGIGAIDLGSALWAAIGIQSALIVRDHTGEGGLVDASLFGTAAWWLSYHLTGFWGSGVTPTRQGTRTAFLAPYEAFPTATDDLFVAAGNDQLFSRLCHVLGEAELAEDQRFRDNPNRIANREVLRILLERAFSRRTAGEWESLLQEHGVPCSRVRSVEEFAQDPQLAALELVTSIPHPTVGELKLVDIPIQFNGQRNAHRYAPPSIGEHTDEILDELGYDDSAIAELRASGVVV
jgi:crotonobetainyl-CoA:carnitine CoA-transferase CaiB-like acyl-CoA transferase